RALAGTYVGERKPGIGGIRQGGNRRQERDDEHHDVSAEADHARQYSNRVRPSQRAQPADRLSVARDGPRFTRPWHHRSLTACVAVRSWPTAPWALSSTRAASRSTSPSTGST